MPRGLRIEVSVWAATLAVFLPGCGGARERAQAQKEKAEDPAAATAPGEAEAKPGASPLAGEPGGGAGPMPSGAMAAAGLLNALGQAGQPGPWDEPRRSPTANDREPHVAVVELAGQVTELADMSLLSLGPSGLPLRGVADRLGALARDPEVTAIVMRVGDLSLAMAQAEELRALVVATATKKPVHCFTEGAASATYVVLSACTTLGLSPSGGLSITGPAIAPMYMRGLMAKLGVEPDFIHIGAFKGAAEPLTRDGPSPQMRATYDAILDGSHEALVAAVAAGRKLSPERARALVDVGVFTDGEAKASGLVDAVAPWETFLVDTLKGAPWIRVAVKKEPAKDMAGLMEVLGLTPRPRISKPHVAVIYAVGEVVDGTGDGMLSAFTEIASRRLSAALRAAAADDSVKAVVLRVDSPGGSALASEQIWHAVQAVKAARKPVVVSMGAVAASGGYYIACAADAIWAQPNTLTGSIGVVGGKLVLGGALSKVGVSVVEMGRGKRSLLMSTARRWSSDERTVIENEMRAVYGVFKQRVADGRKRKPEDIEPIAQGRVWTGLTAKDNGLVDRIGGLSDALADARTRAGLGDEAPVDVYPAEPTLLELLEGLGGNVSMGAQPSLMASVLADLERVLGPRPAHTLAATMRLVLGFGREPVRAVVLLPITWR
jgi:protease-4